MRVSISRGRLFADNAGWRLCPLISAISGLPDVCPTASTQLPSGKTRISQSSRELDDAGKLITLLYYFFFFASTLARFCGVFQHHRNLSWRQIACAAAICCFLIVSRPLRVQQDDRLGECDWCSRCYRADGWRLCILNFPTVEPVRRGHSLAALPFQQRPSDAWRRSQ